jgi:hypothetical protein
MYSHLRDEKLKKRDEVAKKFKKLMEVEWRTGMLERVRYGNHI